VQFTGMVPRAAVYAQMAEADVYVSTSHGEGLPVAVLEAMACRCPVVLSDIPPHRELADGEAAVVLAPVSDVARFADGIRALARMDAEGRTALGERCRRRIEQCYSLTVMHDAYRPIYREAAEASVSP
jgi:glycosyltransferase involved in cell wall biosynthesis